MDARDPALSPEPPAALYSKERLLKNLEALARVDAELADRLTWPVEGEHVVFGPEGQMLYVLHRDPCSLAIPPSTPGLELLEHERVLLLGIGEGDLVARALAAEGQRELWVWERDPWLLRLELERRDHGEALASGRLRLLLGPDLLDHRGFEGSVIPHPLLAAPYQVEIESFHAEPLERRALLCVGKLFVPQVARALRDQGFDLWSLDASRHAPEELQRTVERFDPERIVSINHTPGLAEFCHDLGRQLTVWEVDPSQFATPACTTPTDHTWIWTHRRRHVEQFRRAGYRNVSYLPLAADPRVRRPLEAAEREALDDAHRAPISFVGNSLLGGAARFQAQFLQLHSAWLGAGARVSPASTALLEELLVGQRADRSRFLVPDLLESRAPGFRADVLRNPHCPDPAILVGELAGAEKRLSAVATLARLGVSVWGDAGWRKLEPLGVAYRGPAGHHDQLTRIYNGSAINLDVGRVYQPDIVTMRVFDVLACGAFVLAEHTEALEEVFEVGVEVESYRDVQELEDKARHYLEHPDEARAVAERGRARVLRDHTIAGRVEHMLAAG